MTERLYMHGEAMELEQAHINKVAELSFAAGKVGYGYELADEAAETAHAQALAASTRELTVINTAHCGDERRIVSFADHTDDPAELARFVVSQVFGGIGLATTKALIAANAVVARDAKSMPEVYEKVVLPMLKEFNLEDASHGDCGASKHAEASVGNPIAFEQLSPAVRLLVPANIATDERLQRIQETKHRRLEAGFYGTWDMSWHADLVASRFPHNFANLAIDPTAENGGHHGSSLYVITEEDKGFAKNDFIDATGQEAFCITLPAIQKLAAMFGGSEQERHDILTAFVDDQYHVGARIVRPDFPVFAQAA